MIRFKFYDLFQELPNGSLTPKREIIINGISFGPGVSFTRGVSFSGVDILQYKGFEIAGEENNGAIIIKGFYK